MNTTRLSVAIQTAFFLLGTAWIVDVIAHRPDILVSSPFPQSSPNAGLPVAFTLLFVGVVLYILAAFNVASYWQRLYRVLLFVGVILGLHYIAAVMWPEHPSWMVYVIAAAVTTLNFTTKQTSTHTLTQFLLIIGVTLWTASHISQLQATLLLVAFSLYDLVAGFLPRQMFDAVAKFFQVDHLVSVVIPDQVSGWWKSHHKQQTAMRSLDIMIPIIFATLITFPLGTVAYWLVVSGWVIGMLVRQELNGRLQQQLIIPALCSLLGYAFALL